MPDELPNGITRYRVEQHERKLTDFERRLEKVLDSQNQIKLRIAEMTGDIRDLRTDIAGAAAQLEQGRRDDVDSLKASIQHAQESTRNVMVYVMAPFFVAVIAGLLVFAISGGIK